MSDLISRAVIPTNSLVLMSDEIDDKLSPVIQRLKATSSVGNPTKKSVVNKYMRRHQASSEKLYLTFNRGKSKDEINICRMVEDAREAGFHDLWVHELVLRLKYRGSLWDFEFRNQPLTEGSEAANWIMRYLNSLKDGGWVKLTQVRHLPLTSALSVPEGASMSPYDISDPAFIGWLSEITYGLIRLKTVRRVDDTTFVDVAIKELK